MERKYFIGLASIVTIAITAVCATFAIENNSQTLTDLQKQNIEALTGTDIPTDGSYTLEDPRAGGGDGRERRKCWAQRGERSEMSTAVICGNPGCFHYTGYRPQGKQGTC